MNKSKEGKTSTTLPRITSRSTTFITSTTDDVSFAQNQINKITRSNYLHEYYKLKPWEKAPNNIYKDSGTCNYVLLSDLRKKIKIENKSVKDLNWAKQNYFHQEELDKFFDAAQIVRRFNTKKSCKEPYIDLFTYSAQSKDICIKNMLIDLMNEERNKLNVQQKEISTALAQSMQELSKDVIEFDSFKEEVKKKAKESELVLNAIMQRNKKLIEKKKKCTQEHRLILDEIEKSIRQIINMKYYAMFVHTLLGGGDKIVSCSLGDSIEIKNNREKELEDYSTKIFDEFGFLECDDVDDDNILKDSARVMNIYDVFESNIIKLISQKEEFDKEQKNLSEQNERLLSDLVNKVDAHEKEFVIYTKEKEKIEKDINEIITNSPHDEFVKYSIDLISEIENTLLSFSLSSTTSLCSVDSKFKVSKKIQSIMLSLTSIENEINEHISTLESFEKENKDTFSQVVEDRKKVNKYNRHIEEKRLIKERQDERASRLNRKMNQFVIKGRGRWQVPIPPHILQKRKKKVEKHIENNDDFKMIEY